MENKEIPVTISLNQKYIYVTFEYKKEIIRKTEGNYVGLDLNPNYIALSLFNKNDKRINSYAWKLNELTKLSGKASNSKKSKYLENKLKFETIEISKEISNICKQNNIDFVFFEELSIKARNHEKGINYNRLVNNKWKRNLFINNLKKRLDIYGIKWFEINATYSSLIGNLLNFNYPDPIAASIEIARRGIEVIIKKSKKFLPLLELNQISSHWKDLLFANECSSWKEIYRFFQKNSKLKYRIPWLTDHVFRKFLSKNSKISYILL